MGRWSGRVAAAAVGLIAAITVSGVGYAHVEVRAEPAIAGATNAVVTLQAEAESNTAGIVSVRVVLPAGITPAEVTLTQGPTSWSITPGADGYTVGGPALPPGQDAVHSITVARLPDATRLVFKVLVNYSDGGVDRWIEEPTPANPEPANPAVVLDLQPAPRTTSPASPPGTPAAVTISAPAATATGGAATGAEGSGGGSWLWWLAVAAALVAAAVVVVLLRRRATPTNA